MGVTFTDDKGALLALRDYLKGKFIGTTDGGGNFTPGAYATHYTAWNGVTVVLQDDNAVPSGLATLELALDDGRDADANWNCLDGDVRYIRVNALITATLEQGASTGTLENGTTPDGVDTVLAQDLSRDIKKNWEALEQLGFIDIRVRTQKQSGAGGTHKKPHQIEFKYCVA